MENLKFRAWLKKEKKMANVLMIDFTEKTICIHPLNLYKDKKNFAYTEIRGFEKVILMQYIGKKDINGLRIYEGDILFRTMNGLNYEIVYDESSSQFLLVNNNDCLGTFNLDEPDEEFKIVGNIYKNPELLKVKE